MSFQSRIDHLTNAIQPLRDELIHHPLYQNLQSLRAIKIFMEHHVFAVWDFMSLLKCMQRHLTRTTIPWIPASDATAARMVNEIVLAEETDEDERGAYASHFELYLRAMDGCGADTMPIHMLVAKLRDGYSVLEALKQLSVSESVYQFVRTTFELIDSEDLCSIASSFTFGREDLLPNVFERIVERIDLESGGELKGFRYYLSRHIELDGDQHGPLACQLVGRLCGEDDSAWSRAEDAAIRSLEARKRLWDGMLQAIMARDLLVS